MTDPAVERDAREKIGQLLVERQALSPQALARALEKPAKSESDFLASLVEAGDATEGAIVAFLAERSGFPGVDLSKSAFLLGVLELIPRPVAEHDQLLPLSTEGGRLHVAVISPSTVRESIDEIRFITGMEISLYIALPNSLAKCIAASFDARERGDTIWRGSGLGHTAPARLAIHHPSPVGPQAAAAEERASSSPGMPKVAPATSATKTEAAAVGAGSGPAPAAPSAAAPSAAASSDATFAPPASEAEARTEGETKAPAAPAPAAAKPEIVVELAPEGEILEGEIIEDAELIEESGESGPLYTPIRVSPVPRSSPGTKAIPAAPPAPKAAPAMIEIEVADDRGDDGEEEELVVSVHTGPKRILVVDDEPDIIRLCTRALQIKGYLVESAIDGALAEARLKKAPPPDLVLLDAMLPLVHGFEICQRIKSSKALRGVQVVMMSAVYRGWRFAQDAKETYGADDFIEKPFHLADLLRRVDERLAEGKPQQTARQSTEKLYRSGVEALAAGKAVEGRKALESAAREDPFSPRIQFALGGALAAIGDTYRAISAYERAVELRPKLFPALKALAGLYLEKGFRKKASETLERAFACAPEPAAREEIRLQLTRLI